MKKDLITYTRAAILIITTIFLLYGFIKSPGFIHRLSSQFTFSEAILFTPVIVFICLILQTFFAKEENITTSAAIMSLLQIFELLLMPIVWKFDSSLSDAIIKTITDIGNIIFITPSMLLHNLILRWGLTPTKSYIILSIINIIFMVSLIVRNINNNFCLYVVSSIGLVIASITLWKRTPHTDDSSVFSILIHLGLLLLISLGITFINTAINLKHDKNYMKSDERFIDLPDHIFVKLTAWALLLAATLWSFFLFNDDVYDLLHSIVSGGTTTKLTALFLSYVCAELAEFLVDKIVIVGGKILEKVYDGLFSLTLQFIFVGTFSKLFHDQITGFLEDFCNANIESSVIVILLVAICLLVIMFFFGLPFFSNLTFYLVLITTLNVLFVRNGYSNITTNNLYYIVFYFLIMGRTKFKDIIKVALGY